TYTINSMIKMDYDGPLMYEFFFFSSRRRHTRSKRDWSSDVCSSDLNRLMIPSLWILCLSSSLIRALTSLSEYFLPCPLMVSRTKIGRASCRERVEDGGGAVKIMQKWIKRGTKKRSTQKIAERRTRDA